MDKELPTAEANAEAKKNPKGFFERKWDWDLAFALFIGGMSHDEILKLPQFQGMNKKMLANRSAKFRWINKRQEMAESLGSQLARPLAERLAEAADIHQEFMRTRLDKERKVIDNQIITNSADDQRKRLENLRLVDDMSRKLTGLDDRKPLNPTQLNLAITVHMAAGHHPHPKNGKAGILGAANAIQEGIITTQKVLKDGALIEAASILRAKEAGTLEQFAKSSATLDLDVQEIDRAHLNPLPGLSVKEESPNDLSEDEVLVDENDTAELVEELREAGYDAHDVTGQTPEEILNGPPKT